MRISELSRRGGVSVATIKYYIREELLPPGRLTAATQAEYDEHHLRRLRLIRALVGVGGLPVSTTRDVLRALSEGPADTHRVLGVALAASRSPDEAVPEPRETHAVNALIQAMGWQVHEDASARSAIAETLGTMRDLGLDFGWESLLPYARLTQEMAALDLDGIEGVADPLEVVERAIVLTVVLEPALLALRRMAQENESALRHGRGRGARGGTGHGFEHEPAGHVSESGPGQDS